MYISGCCRPTSIDDCHVSNLPDVPPDITAVGGK
jgi:hypothetical protein